MSEIQKQRVWEIYYVLQSSGVSGGVGAAEIARLVGMKPTPYLRGLLDEMVRNGWLTKHQGMIKTGSGLRMGWLYEVVPGQQ